MPPELSPDVAESKAKAILEWLAAAHGEASPEHVETLRQHLLALCGLPLPAPRHLQLLDFLYEHAIKVVAATLPTLHNVALPISRRRRAEMRNIQNVLETLSADYLRVVDQIYADDQPPAQRIAASAMWRAVNSLAQHLLISHIAAAPAEVGIWQMLHGAYKVARQRELADQHIPRQQRTLQEVYLSAVLLECAQPASFSSQELEFISEYILLCVEAVALSDTAPQSEEAIFWLDPDKDAPSNPLARRSPPPGANALFFACDSVAQSAQEHLEALEIGYPAHQLELPVFAETPAGHGVLRRLAARWGKPPKRRFPRRRHSYRATLCAGLDELWRLLQAPENYPATPSEWMVTNESPDGLAMMHMTGKTGHLRVGDIVAIRPENKAGTPVSAWSICIVRWALSENPEHIELGLQILAPTAVPALLVIPRQTPKGQTPALLLPGIPPLRPSEAVVVSTGTMPAQLQKLTLVIGQDNLSVREVRNIGLTEQTANIEVFSVETERKL